MESLVDFFQHASSATRTLILAGGLVFFWLLEGVLPLFKMKFRRLQHAGLNLFFTFTTVAINFAFAFLIVRVSDWAVAKHFGVLHLTPLPLWLYVLLGLMILDLISAYWIHYIQHKIKWMWKFHLIHHTDTWVDITTANRHHPGESVFRAVFTLIAVLVSGAPMWLVILYQTFSVAFSQFIHANIRLPKKIDEILSWIIVSPNMHKVHHHYVQPLTDTNYGNIFSIWDRIFGTFVRVKDISQLKYGIDTHMQEHEHNRTTNLLSIPFHEYRAPIGSKFGEEPISSEK